MKLGRKKRRDYTSRMFADDLAVGSTGVGIFRLEKTTNRFSREIENLFIFILELGEVTASDDSVQVVREQRNIAQNSELKILRGMHKTVAEIERGKASKKFVDKSPNCGRLGLGHTLVKVLIVVGNQKTGDLLISISQNGEDKSAIIVSLG